MTKVNYLLHDFDHLMIPNHQQKTSVINTPNIGPKKGDPTAQQTPLIPPAAAPVTAPTTPFATALGLDFDLIVPSTPSLTAKNRKCYWCCEESCCKIQKGSIPIQLL